MFPVLRSSLRRQRAKMSNTTPAKLFRNFSVCRKCLAAQNKAVYQKRWMTNSAVEVSYHYEVKDQQFKGSPLLILHGLMGSLSNWSSLSKNLALSGRKIIRMDARNHGDSPHSEIMTYHAMSNDTIKVMDDLNIEKACLMGHSMGGKVFMTTALMHPERVAGLIVVDVSPTPSPSAKSFPGYLNCMLKISTRFPEMKDVPLSQARHYVIETLKEVEDHLGIRQFLAANLIQMNGKFMWRVNLDAIINNYKEMSSFPKFNTQYKGPTLFIGGERSPYISPSTMPDIMNLFPYAKIEHIPRAGHWVHSDNPSMFLDSVRTFLTLEDI